MNLTQREPIRELLESFHWEQTARPGGPTGWEQWRRTNGRGLTATLSFAYYLHGGDGWDLYVSREPDESGNSEWSLSLESTEFADSKEWDLGMFKGILEKISNAFDGRDQDAALMNAIGNLKEARHGTK